LRSLTTIVAIFCLPVKSVIYADIDPDRTLSAITSYNYSGLCRMWNGEYPAFGYPAW